MRRGAARWAMVRNGAMVVVINPFIGNQLLTDRLFDVRRLLLCGISSFVGDDGLIHKQSISKKL
jgi:hypothetical protein